jgi:hypothetical protein
MRLDGRCGVAAPEAKGFAQLFARGGCNIFALEDTGIEMAIEYQEAGTFEAGTSGQELREDVLAGPLLFKHLAKATDLAFHAREAIEELFLFGGVHRLLLVDEGTPLGYATVIVPLTEGVSTSWHSLAVGN